MGLLGVDIYLGDCEFTYRQSGKEPKYTAYSGISSREVPSLCTRGMWDSIKLLSAVSDTGETFFFPCEEDFNSDTTIRLLDALQTEFGEKLCIILDNALYSPRTTYRSSLRRHRSNCAIFRGIHRS